MLFNFITYYFGTLTDVTLIQHAGPKHMEEPCSDNCLKTKTQHVDSLKQNECNIATQYAIFRVQFRYVHTICNTYPSPTESPSIQYHPYFCQTDVATTYCCPSASRKVYRSRFCRAEAPRSPVCRNVPAPSYAWPREHGVGPVRGSPWVCVCECVWPAMRQKRPRTHASLCLSLTLVGPVYLTLHHIRAAILWHLSLPGDLCQQVMSARTRRQQAPVPWPASATWQVMWDGSGRMWMCVSLSVPI